MNGNGYMDGLRGKLGAAMTVYGLSDDGRLAMSSALSTWIDRCHEAGVPDTPETRAAALSMMQPLLADDSMSGDELRDAMATIMMALL